MGEYEEFEHICFVDTLDHAAFHLKQMDLFAMSVENTQRIQNQNDRNISVIIGNPPYNANQQNENDNNKNRKYPAIDKRIKDTYVKESTAQKTKVYDPYSRFFRWATDRLGENGIIAFITNSSFIDARTFDGFRKVVAEEFSEIYIVDLGGDVRKNPKISGTTHNIFGIQTGVAISFMLKKATKNETQTPCKIFYIDRPDLEIATHKLSFLASSKIDQIAFEHIIPDKNNNWINFAYTDFESLLPLANKETKLAQNIAIEKAVFKVFAPGVVTARDEWVYDFNRNHLIDKIKFFIDIYNENINKYQTATNKVTNIDNFVDHTIKWSESLKKYLKALKTTGFTDKLVILQSYRPFVKNFFYADFILNDRLTNYHAELFGKGFDYINSVIYFSGVPSSKPFQVFASNDSANYDFLEKTQCLPLYRYDKEGNRIDNITDWGLQQFQNHYNDKTITKLDIFHYTYAVLHYPEYRSKYELNLKREFPRLPFYDNFSQWVEWGSKLMELHINYETVAPYPLTRIDTNNNLKPKTKLKADREKNSINLDDVTFLQDIPKIAWEYKLGNRSALEWILDQYKEKKPKDQTIAERFNNYRFADYKETVIDLLQRVCTVSVETMKIIEAMRD
jgi:predicted helicase